jgi:hypothetical protein
MKRRLILEEAQISLRLPVRDVAVVIDPLFTLQVDELVDELFAECFAEQAAV